MIHTKAFIRMGKIEVPVDIHTTLQGVPSSYSWQEALKRMYNTTITCTGYLTDSEGNHQPTGPVVEGSIEPLQG